MIQDAKKALIFIGPQGCGKATQSQILREEAGYVHIDTGAYLRSFASKESSDPLVLHVRDFVTHGHLLEDEVICEIFERALEEKAKGADKIILDGIPRTVSQAAIVLYILKKGGYSDISVINLVVPEEESLIRLKKRAVIEKRLDDADEEKILRRLALYEKETKPVLTFLKERAVPVYTIDGIGSTIEIGERIRVALKI